MHRNTASAPIVLGFNSDAARRVQKTAKEFARLTDATAVPEIIRRAGLQYFQIAVGSEVSCIVNPNVCWVANRRTIWAGLVEKHEGDVSKANQALALYLEPDVDSDMHYSKWTALHEDLGDRMRTLAREGAKVARKSGVSAGTLTFLWADSIAAWLYEELHG